MQSFVLRVRAQGKKLRLLRLHLLQKSSFSAFDAVCFETMEWQPRQRTVIGVGHAKLILKVRTQGIRLRLPRLHPSQTSSFSAFDVVCFKRHGIRWQVRERGKQVSVLRGE